MKITPDELTGNGYVLLDQLDHKELLPFVRTYINKRTKFSASYSVAILVLFGLTGYLFVQGFRLPEYDLAARFTHFAIGIALAFALLPLHEFIHVLAYKSQGARKTSYDANLKKFYFMALADRFVANRKEFAVVALAPFVVITASLFILLFVVDANWRMTVVAMLLAHTTMCSGDFGLLSYFEFNKDKEIVTYDDTENRVSYFFGRQKE